MNLAKTKLRCVRKPSGVVSGRSASILAGDPTAVQGFNRGIMLTKVKVGAASCTRTTLLKSLSPSKGVGRLLNIGQTDHCVQCFAAKLVCVCMFGVPAEPCFRRKCSTTA